MSHTPHPLAFLLLAALLPAQRTPLPQDPEPSGVASPRAPVVGWAAQTRQDPAVDDAPDYAPGDGSNPYVLAFQNGVLAPEPGLDPRLAARIQAEPSGSTFGFVMLQGRMLRERIVTLQQLGVEVLGAHTWQCVKARIPHAQVAALLRLPYVRWIGLATLEQKLAPDLARTLAGAPAALDAGEGGAARLHVHVSLFASDLGPGAARELVPATVPAGGSQAERGASPPLLRWRTEGPVLGRLRALGFVDEGYDEPLRAYTGTATQAQLRQILADDAVLYAEPVLRMRAFHDQSVAIIDHDRVRGTRPGRGISLGVIDSGIGDNPWHNDLTNKWWWWWDTTGLGATKDGNGHGTHVTGTMIGLGLGDQRLIGMSPAVGEDGNARVFLGRYLKNDGFSTGDPGTLYNAFASPPSGKKPAAVNNSWGAAADTRAFSGMEFSCRQVDATVFDHGITYVFAAGNSGGAFSCGAPAVAKNALTVGSVTNQNIDGRVAWRSTFSDYGSADGRLKPDVMAPGEVITSCRTNTADQYSQMQGTSMAAPHVTGVIAGLAQANGFFEYNPSGVKALMMATAQLAGRSAPEGMGIVDSHRMHHGSLYVYSGQLSAPLTWNSFDIQVPAGARWVRVVTAWAEPAASAGASQTRQVDLETWLDIEPYSLLGNAGEVQLRSNVDNVLASVTDAGIAGSFANLARGRNVRVKIYARSVPINFSARWSACVAFGYSAVTVQPVFTTSVTATDVKPNASLTVRTRVEATPGADDFRCAAIALNQPGTVKFPISLMQRTTFDGIVHAYAGSGYWSYPYPAPGVMVVGTGQYRELEFQLRAPTTEGRHTLIPVLFGTGPYQENRYSICVDGTPPPAVAGLTSSSHTPNTWSSATRVQLAWSFVTDVGCAGVDGQAHAFDQNPATVPATRTMDPFQTTLQVDAASSASGHWFAIRAFDKAGNWTTTTSRVGPFLVDAVAPVLTSVTVDNGATYTTDLTVAVETKANDAHSGLDRMSVSLDGSTWSAWSPFVQTIPSLNLAEPSLGGNASEGTKTVYVRVRDRAGNVSTTVSDSITYLRCPQIGSLSQTTFPSVEPNAIVVNGSDIQGVTAVIFGSRTITNTRLENMLDGAFLISGDSLLYLHPPQGLPPGQYTVRLVNAACTSNGVVVNLVAPTTPRLATSTFPRAGGPQTVLVHKGALSSSAVSYLALSPSNAPSSLPGTIELGIGAGFTSLTLLPVGLGHDPVTGVARFGPFGTPPGIAGAVLHFQGIVVDLGNPGLRPIPVTNVVRSQYVP
ncbi:MAG: S8 family serine peptidase [Planctomycetes bacterium]|nr:S8 family serine peptidase [Planctomycetota bacterium]